MSDRGIFGFSAEDAEGLQDFWRVYDDNYDRLTEATLEAARSDPQFRVIVEAMSPAQLEAENRDGRERMRAAIHGEPEAYIANLRAQGALYAGMGISYTAWYRLVRTVGRELTPLLVQSFGATPSRLTAAIVGMQGFFDSAMAIIGETYLAAKEAAKAAVIETSLRLEHENKRINAASRLKSEFLANMSHELRTPLNSIIGFAELLHDGEVRPDMPEHQEFLADILRSGRHLLQLINDVLDLSKVEAGKLEFHPEPIDLAAVIGEVLGILRTAATMKQIRISTEIDPTLDVVHVDASRFKQVLYNYLSNALKFTPDGGRIGVHVRPEGSDAFRLEVVDTGPGIAGHDQERLFTEFQQLDAGPGKQHQGTGLGLALTRRLVEAQGGTVGVASHLGRGSTFHAVLPLRASGEPMLAPLSRPSAPDAPRILVVEDDARDLELLVRALSDAGYGVETAVTGASAVARCRERSFDAITLDLLLPDASGLDVLRAIRAEGLNRDVPVVVITVVTEHGAVGGFAVHDILPKPVDGDAMLQSLARARVAPQATSAVLVVEDDPASARLMAATLGQLGYRATCVPRAIEGLESVALGPPLAVVLDLTLPEMDGFEFLERFRSLPHCRPVPVIVWTSKDLSREEYARLRSSAQGVLQKGRGAGVGLIDDLRTLLRAGEAGDAR